MSEDAAKYVTLSLLKAMKHFHDQGIAHRDIKLENILISNGIVKIADFGVAINLLKERGVTRAGTLNYISPEVLACPYKRHPMDNKTRMDIGGYSTNIDIWSLGVLVYELLNGASPYATESLLETEKLISIGSLPVFLNQKLSEKAQDFVYSCLVLDPNKRPSVDQLLEHPWLSVY
jgi:serine/threonine protein kinase